MSEFIIRVPDDALFVKIQGIEGTKVAGYAMTGEVVRCRDCTEFAFGDVACATVDWCDYWGGFVESPDGFCAWGERRER